MDDKGRVLFGYSDGCISAGCIAGTSGNNNAAAMRVARQIGGRPLLSQFDVTEPVLPKAACLSGTRNSSGVHLTWKIPDNGGADIVSYRIFRGTAAGNETFLTATGNTKASYDDITADPSQTAYYIIRAVNSVDAGGGTFSNEVTFAATPGIQLLGITSTKTHGGAGVFDVNLPLDGSGIECRSGGTNNNHTLVFNFANPVSSVTSAALVAGTGSIASASVENGDFVVSLIGVTNAQRITVTLTGVTDSAGNSAASVSATMGVLLGDVNASARVDSGDVSLVRQQTLQTITTSNFREDINASGRVDAGDVSIARQQALTSLP